MNIPTLLRTQSTLVQLDILARADRLIVTGRYYGGELTTKELELLTEGLKLK